MIFLVYIFKLIISSTLLYAYYRLFLCNKQFHVYNRFYLLGTVALSIILPLLKIPLQNLWGSENIQNGISLLLFSNWEEAITITPGNAYSFFYVICQNLGYIAYIVVLVVLLFRLNRSLRYIRKISRSYPYQQMRDIKFFETTEPGAPFSFFNRVFWNRELDIESPEGQQVFRHELYHVHHKHSTDILFLEIISILFWFNPVFHLIKKEMKAIHEFLADSNVVSGNNRFDYAELLVLRSFSSKYPQLINPFFHNQIKRRIAMITKLQHKRSNYFSRIMMFPLLFALFLTFACTRDQSGISPMAGGVTPKIYTKVEIEADYPGGPEAWQRYLSHNLHYPDKAVNNEIQGDVLVQFIVDNEGKVSDVKAISGPEELKEESIRVIAGSGKWTPAVQQGQKVYAYKLQPIKYRLERQ